MKTLQMTLFYVMTLSAGILVTIGIFLDKGIGKALTLGFGIGLYNGVILTLVNKKLEEK